MSEKKEKDQGSRIRLKATPVQNLKAVPPRLEHPDTPIGAYTQKITNFLNLSAQQHLYMYVQKAGSFFIPSPDQTVGDLAKIFATEHPTDGLCLQLSYCTQVFQG